MAAVVPIEEINSGISQIQNMTDSDLEYLEQVAQETLGPSGVSARVRYGGEGHRLPAGGPHTFTGAHGTMSPIDVGDDDAEIPSAQPDPVDVAEESLRGYIEAEHIPGSFPMMVAAELRLQLIPLMLSWF